MTPVELDPPHGRAAVERFYGWDPEQFLDDEGRIRPTWERTQMVALPLPAPLQFLGRPVHRMRVHKRISGVFAAVYEDILAAGLWSVVEPYAGAFEPRLIRGGDQLSMHAFGAAVDHDPARNPLGAPVSRCRFGNTAEGQAVVRIFERHGFTWGGTFSGRKDAMHFQYASGY